jgi:hypothetical protein
MQVCRHSQDDSLDLPGLGPKAMFISKDQPGIARKPCILKHAKESGHIVKMRRYFGVGRSRFDHRRGAYGRQGAKRLVNHPPTPKWPANRTPMEVEEKVLHLWRKHHLGLMRIVGCLALSHQNIGRRCLSDVEAKWNQLAFGPHPTAQDTFQVRQPAGSRALHSNRRMSR